MAPAMEKARMPGPPWNNGIVVVVLQIVQAGGATGQCEGLATFCAAMFHLNRQDPASADSSNREARFRQLTFS